MTPAAIDELLDRIAEAFIVLPATGGKREHLHAIVAAWLEEHKNDQ